MKIIFLGTGTSQGVPQIGCKSPVCLSKNPKDKRLRSSIFIKGDFGNIIIDTSTDFRTQLLRENIDSVDAVLYTHEHIDHTGGLDDLRPLIYSIKGNIKNMPIFASKKVITHLKKTFYYIFNNSDYPGIPKLDLHMIDEKPFIFNNQKIIPIKGLHGKLPIFGFRINNFAYLTDFSKILESEYKKLEGLDTLIINCLRKEEPHHSHFILPEVLKEIKKINPKKAYLTHISYRLGFHDEVEKELPENVFLGYDGLTLHLKL